MTARGRMKNVIELWAGLTPERWAAGGESEYYQALTDAYFEADRWRHHMAMHWVWSARLRPFPVVMPWTVGDGSEFRSGARLKPRTVFQAEYGGPTGRPGSPARMVWLNMPDPFRWKASASQYVYRNVRTFVLGTGRIRRPPVHRRDRVIGYVWGLFRSETVQVMSVYSFKAEEAARRLPILVSGADAINVTLDKNRNALFGPWMVPEPVWYRFNARRESPTVFTDRTVAVYTLVHHIARWLGQGGVLPAVSEPDYSTGARGALGLAERAAEDVVLREGG